MEHSYRNVFSGDGNASTKLQSLPGFPLIRDMTTKTPYIIAVRNARRRRSLY
jgi:hypothetical protein